MGDMRNCLTQIKYWQETIHQQEKAIRRKNKRINSLQKQVSALNIQSADLALIIAEDVAKESDLIEKVSKLDSIKSGLYADAYISRADVLALLEGDGE
ncbi:unnamed protein product [marine sediment metagenome]|uniref:Uncharacterized protein n=1 Tax=marine sediment metagenome TaxID=412755 RepID=X1LET8_9ZZZZ